MVNGVWHRHLVGLIQPDVVLTRATVHVGERIRVVLHGGSWRRARSAVEKQDRVPPLVLEDVPVAIAGSGVNDQRGVGLLATGVGRAVPRSWRSSEALRW